MTIPLKTAIEAVDCLKICRALALTYSPEHYQRVMQAQVAMQVCLEPLLSMAIEVAPPTPADAEFEFHRRNLTKAAA